MCFRGAVAKMFLICSNPDPTSVPSSVPLFDIVNTDPAGGALRPALRQTMAGAEEVLCVLPREGRNPLAKSVEKGPGELRAFLPRAKVRNADVRGGGGRAAAGGGVQEEKRLNCRKHSVHVRELSSRTPPPPRCARRLPRAVRLRRTHCAGEESERKVR